MFDLGRATVIESGGNIRLRADLVDRPVWMGSKRVWVIKDPLAPGFIYLSDHEHEILQLADGTRTLEQIVAATSARFAPSYYSGEAILRYFASASEQRLLVSTGHRQYHTTSLDNRRTKAFNPLAIRLPGFQPDRLLTALDPLVRPFFSPLAIAGMLLVVGIAACLAVMNSHELLTNVSTAWSTTAVANIGLVAIVIALAKIIHELAHAIMCRRLGGECREIGVMILLGIPVLYCDVSDVWMMRYRYQRILVSAAGMIAEVVLASLAMIVWMAAIDGPVRDLCVIVISVCSVSTLLLNGNPLMRYDGYYIASDLLGFPNLASESAGTVRSWVRRALWGLPAPVANETSISAGRQLGLACYWIASLSYRIALYAAILGLVYRAAEQRGFGGLVGCIILAAVLVAIARITRAWVEPPDASVRRFSMTPKRPMYILGLCGAFIFLAGLLPLPRFVVAPLVIQPQDAVSVYVTVPGRLTSAVIAGDDVVGGQPIAQLSNLDIDRELVTIRNERERLRVQLESLRSKRSRDPEIASRIPSLEKSWLATQQRIELLESDASKLTIRAPRTGRVFEQRGAAKPVLDERQSQYWIGSALDPENVGATMESATVLCTIGEPLGREAILNLRQQDIELIRVDQSVSLILSGWPSNSITGRISHVASSPIQPDDDQDCLRINSDGDGDVDPRSPCYRVRVTLDDSGDGLPVNLTGHARIRVAPASAWQRVMRFIIESFGWL